MPSTQPELIAGRYRVRERLGQGGMGVVYLAEDAELPRLVAVKLLRDDDPELHERFAREARLAASLDHPNIVTIYDRGIHEGQPFIVMQYITGESLEEMVRRRAPLPLARKLHLIADLCDGLAFAHRAGVVHRDVKPANLKISREGVLKILDFGIARQVESGFTRAGSMIGTVSYMSPEQVAGEPVDHRSDQFSVGLVLYELLSYQKAFPGDERVVPLRIQTAEPKALTEYDPHLDATLVQVVARAIRKSPDERYPDLLVMRKELLRLADRAEADKPHLVAIRPAIDSTVVIPRPNRGSSPHSDPGRFVERRRAQIEALLDKGRRALGQNQLEDAVSAAEEAGVLDPDDPRIHELLKDAGAALDERQVAAWLSEAEDRIHTGALTAASDLVARSLDLIPRAAAAVALQARLRALLEERARSAHRDRAVRQATSSAEDALREGAYESAIRYAGEALAFDATHQEAEQIRRRARAALEARRLKEEDEARRAAEERARRQTAAEGEARRAAEERAQRQAAVEEDARRAVAERARRQAAAAAEARKAGEERARRQAAAEEDARRLAEADARRRADAEAEIRKAAERAASERAAAEAAEDRRRAIDDALASAADALSKGDVRSAAVAVETLRQLGAAPDVVSQLDQRIGRASAARAESQRRDAEDRRASTAIESSRRHFAEGRMDAALADLERFSPPHPFVSAALTGLRHEVDAERRRQRAEAAAHEASRRRATAELLAAARAHVDAGEFSNAFATIDELLAREPDHQDARQLRRTIEQAKAAADVAAGAQQAVARSRERAASGHYADAIGVLEQFSPPHELVDSALATLRLVAAKHEQRAARSVAEARTLFDSGGEEEALSLLADFAPDHPLVSSTHDTLRATLEQREHDAAPALSRAAALEGSGQLAEALALLENVSPPTPSVRRAISALRAQFAAQHQQRTSQAQELGAAYERKASQIRAAINRNDLDAAERLLTAMRSSFPGVAELELLSEEIRKQREPARTTRTGTSSRVSGRWISAAGAVALVVVAASLTIIVLNRRGTPANDVPRETSTIPSTSSIPTTTSISVNELPQPPTPPPMATAATQKAGELLAKGEREAALAELSRGLRDSATRTEFTSFLAVYIRRVQDQLSQRADRARVAQVTWSPSFRNAENESREAGRVVSADALRRLWSVGALLDQAIADGQRSQQAIGRADDLFQSGSREQALEELMAPGADHLQSNSASGLLQRMRGDAQAKAETARGRATDSGATPADPAYRNATQTLTNAAALARDGRVPDAIKAFWEAEQSFAAAVVPPRPAPRQVSVNTTSIPPTTTSIPTPAGVSDDVLRGVLEQFARAWSTGRVDQFRQAFPQLGERANALQTQMRGACSAVSVVFNSIEVQNRTPRSARVETRSQWGCKLNTAGGRVETHPSTDLFDVAQSDSGAWTITRMFLGGV